MMTEEITLYELYIKATNELWILDRETGLWQFIESEEEKDD